MENTRKLLKLSPLRLEELPPALTRGEVRAFARLLDRAIEKKKATDPKFAAFWAKETGVYENKTRWIPRVK